MELKASTSSSISPKSTVSRHNGTKTPSLSDSDCFENCECHFHLMRRDSNASTIASSSTVSSTLVNSISQSSPLSKDGSNSPSPNDNSSPFSDPLTVPALALTDMLNAMSLQHQLCNGNRSDTKLINCRFYENLLEETLEYFVERIGKQLRCSYACYLIGAIYLQRMLKRNPHLIITQRHLKRLYGISVVIAAKYMDDTYFLNKYYSEVCRTDISTFNDIEELFLSLLQFELYISSEDFNVVREIHRQRQLLILRREETEIPCLLRITEAPTIENKQLQDKASPTSSSAYQRILDPLLTLDKHYDRFAGFKNSTLYNR